MKKDVENNEILEKPKEKIERKSNEEIIGKIDNLKEVLYESRIYDLIVEKENIYFKLSGSYSDRFILEIEKNKIFKVDTLLYNSEEDFIEVRGNF
ncbi:MAG: hypothetical protein ACRDD2_05075 [Sarcina sp.]